MSPEACHGAGKQACHPGSSARSFQEIDATALIPQEVNTLLLLYAKDSAQKARDHHHQARKVDHGKQSYALRISRFSAEESKGGSFADCIETRDSVFASIVSVWEDQMIHA